MKTPAQLAHRREAVARLTRLIYRRMRMYPNHSDERTELLAARDFWYTYARALEWVARP